MSGKTVYLCGGINGLSDADAKNWREAATAALAAAGFIVLDPMRRDFRGVEGDNVAEIVEGDLLDIAGSDVLLVNASRPSWGTAMEVAYANQEGRTSLIVAFGAGPNPSPWLVYHCDRLFPTVDEAVRFLKRAKVPT